MRYWMLRSVSGILAIGWLPPCAYAATAPVQHDLIETRLTPFVNTEVKPHPGERAPQTGNPLWAIHLESLSSTRERPLFSPSRRPPAQAIVAPPPPPPPAAPAVPEQLQLTLVGTVIGGNEHIGVFLDNATRNVVRLEVGQGVAGWTLRDLQARTATFKKDERQTMLALPARNGRQESPPQILANQPAPPPPAAARSSAPRGQNPPANAPKPESSAPVASAHDDVEMPAGSGTWRDGDGQLISRPNSPVPVVNAAADTSAAEKSAAWIDGDGETIAPPPSYRAANDGPPPPPQAATWRDGDGEMIQPPAASAHYGGGTWVDGDGNFVSPPSR